MSNHTPGPWAYRPDKYDDWGTVKGADGYAICQARDHRYCDDDVLNEHRRNKTDPWEANARLISAAPDMYGALLSARVAVRELCEGQHPENECWATLARIDAAIAKAEATE